MTHDDRVEGRFPVFDKKTESLHHEYLFYKETASCTRSVKQQFLLLMFFRDVWRYSFPENKNSSSSLDYISVHHCCWAADWLMNRWRDDDDDGMVHHFI